MEGAVLALALLACPVGMGLMMWFMSRGDKQPQRPASREAGPASLDELRREQARLAVEIERVERDERASDEFARR
jgi:hypothetical protein